jgi:hypothetical protein
LRGASGQLYCLARFSVMAIISSRHWRPETNFGMRIWISNGSLRSSRPGKSYFSRPPRLDSNRVFIDFSPVRRIATYIILATYIDISLTGLFFATSVLAFASARSGRIVRGRLF